MKLRTYYGVRSEPRRSTPALLHRLDHAPVIGPDTHSDAWRKLQDATRIQQQSEEHAEARKQQLIKVEMENDDPDQVMHIKALVQEVEALEGERKESRELFAQQRLVWLAQEDLFQVDLLQSSREFEERAALAGLEARELGLRRSHLRADLVRMEHVLMDLEEDFAQYRGRLHAYDQELTTMIGDKEGLLDSLSQTLATVAGAVRSFEAKTMEKELELAELQKILSLDAKKEGLQGQILAMEDKLGKLDKKLYQARGLVAKG